MQQVEICVIVTCAIRSNVGCIISFLGFVKVLTRCSHRTLSPLRYQIGYLKPLTRYTRHCQPKSFRSIRVRVQLLHRTLFYRQGFQPDWCSMKIRIVKNLEYRRYGQFRSLPIVRHRSCLSHPTNALFALILAISCSSASISVRI